MKKLIDIIVTVLKTLWYNYQSFVRRTVYKSAATDDDITHITSWQENLFINCIIYSIPFSFLAVVPSVVMAYSLGYRIIAAFDLVVVFLVAFVALNHRFSLLLRKTFTVVMFYLLTGVLTCTLGSFGVGSIYLLALSVFIALLFQASVVYLSVAINFIAYVAFTIIIYFKLFHLRLIYNYQPGLWIAYSANFIFLNLVVVTQTRRVVNALSKALTQKVDLLQKLETEAVEKVQRDERLRESEIHYRSLFHLNPSPMWIFDLDDLRFLQINQAAITKYGYTYDEFMGMTIKDIRPPEGISHLMSVLQTSLTIDVPSQNVVQHRCKNGEVFYAEVSCNTIIFNRKQARLVIARNITDQIAYIQAIKAQNKKMHEIAFMQSHIVRAPLARIIALTGLITDEQFTPPDRNVLEYLAVSVQELDDVVKNIISNAEEIIPVQDQISNTFRYPPAS